MAGTNDWLHGYFDALLEASSVEFSSEGPPKPQDPRTKPSEKLREDTGRSKIAMKYFLSEIKGMNDTELFRTWNKATVLENEPSSQEKAARVENICSRVWFLTRREKEMQEEEFERKSRRKREKEEARTDLPEDLARELGDIAEEGREGGEEEEEGDGGEEEKGEVARNEEGSDIAGREIVGEGEANKVMSVKGGERERREEKQKDEAKAMRRLYIVLISIHGLIREENMELGRDSDTGGQVKYVVEFARALAAMPQVYRVDLLTRQIMDPEVHWSYGEPGEMLSPLPHSSSSLGDSQGHDDANVHHNENVGESSGAYIIRLPCGPREKYIRKELLWPYIPEFVDHALAHILHMSKVLGEQITSDCPVDIQGANGEEVGGGLAIAGGLSSARDLASADGYPRVWPYVIHGHYADAADVAAQLSGCLNVPMVLTGHSLGRNKLEQLLRQQGANSLSEIDATYNILRRIEGEEFGLDASEMVITSTRQEVSDQWGLYDGFDERLERALRLRRRRGMTCYGRFMPRMTVIPPGMDFSHVSGLAAPLPGEPEPAIWSEIFRFLSNRHKPIILALARPDPKKNLPSLVKAYGESTDLQELANMVLIMGNRDDIDIMAPANATNLVSVIKLIDKYDLYGKVSYPKHHKQNDVGQIYRLTAVTKGIFVNPALIEPFGLTLIEAAAYGLPMVATKNGGPVDIQKVLNNGLLVDPHDISSLSSQMLSLLSDKSLWSESRTNALSNIHKYSWLGHCRSYLSRVARCRLRHPEWETPSYFALTSMLLMMGGEEGKEGGGESQGEKRPGTAQLGSFGSFGSGAHGLDFKDRGLDCFKDFHDLSINLSLDGRMIGGEGGRKGGEGEGGGETAGESSSHASFGLVSRTLEIVRRLKNAAKKTSSLRFGSVKTETGKSGSDGIRFGSGNVREILLGSLREENLIVGGDGTIVLGEGEEEGGEKSLLGSDSSASSLASSLCKIQVRKKLILVALDDLPPSPSPSPSLSSSPSSTSSPAVEQGGKERGGEKEAGEDERAEETAQRYPENSSAAVSGLLATSTVLKRLVSLLKLHGNRQKVGLAIASHYSAEEIVSHLNASEIDLSFLDCVIASGGSQIYYVVPVDVTGSGDPAGLAPAPFSPLLSSNVSAFGVGWTLSLDEEYNSHVSYRWDREGVALTVPRIVRGVVGEERVKEGGGEIIQEAPHLSNANLLAYKVDDKEKLLPSAELRKFLRVRGLRCSPALSCNNTRLYVTPLHASRRQAMRYLFVRWGIDVADMTVVLHSLGGDEDFSSFLSGSHSLLVVGSRSLRTYASMQKDFQIRSAREDGERGEQVLSHSPKAKTQMGVFKNGAAVEGGYIDAGKFTVANVEGEEGESESMREALKTLQCL